MTQQWVKVICFFLWKEECRSLWITTKSVRIVTKMCVRECMRVHVWFVMTGAERAGCCEAYTVSDGTRYFDSQKVFLFLIFWHRGVTSTYVDVSETLQPATAVWWSEGVFSNPESDHTNIVNLVKKYLIVHNFIYKTPINFATKIPHIFQKYL
jgi:hypothetical protein